MTEMQKMQAIVDAAGCTETDAVALLIKAGKLSNDEEQALIERIDPLGVIDFHDLD